MVTLGQTDTVMTVHTFNNNKGYLHTTSTTMSMMHFKNVGIQKQIMEQKQEKLSK